MKDQPTCATCAFYHDDGHCRRFPPNQPGDKWPSMDGNRWCGEHNHVEPIREVKPPPFIPQPKPGSFTANPKPNPAVKNYTIEEVSKLVAQIAKLEAELKEAREWAEKWRESSRWSALDFPWEERSES